MSTLLANKNSHVSYDEAIKCMTSDIENCINLTTSLIVEMSNVMTNVKEKSCERRNHRNSHIPVRRIHNWKTDTTRIGPTIDGERICQRRLNLGEVQVQN